MCYPTQKFVLSTAKNVLSDTNNTSLWPKITLKGFENARNNIFPFSMGKNQKVKIELEPPYPHEYSHSFVYQVLTTVRFTVMKHWHALC